MLKIQYTNHQDFDIRQNVNYNVYSQKNWTLYWAGSTQKNSNFNKKISERSGIKIFGENINLVFFFHYIWSICYFELKINFYVENSISLPQGSILFNKILITMLILKRIELCIELDRHKKFKFQ